MNDIAPGIDRWNARRTEPRLIDDLRAEPGTRVLVMRGTAARVEGGALRWVTPGEVAEVAEAEWALLGVGSAGIPSLLALLPDATDDPGWQDLRQVGGMLDAEETEFLMMGAALARFHASMPFCSRCGKPSHPVQAGWARDCEGCGAQHFPRADPAAIVAISSPDGEQLLLGANALWKGRMYSCFAGFAEAGESLEAVVHREILEEAGVRVQGVRFVASQPWPYPHSLMVGFRATAIETAEARPDGEEIIDVRWFTRDEIITALAGEGPVALPGPASIARRLIVDWLEMP